MISGFALWLNGCYTDHHRLPVWMAEDEAEMNLPPEGAGCTWQRDGESPCCGCDECNYWKAQTEHLKKEIANLKLQLEKKNKPENYFDFCTKRHTIDCFKIKTGERCDLFGTDCPNEFYNRQEKGALKVD